MAGGTGSTWTLSNYTPGVSVYLDSTPNEYLSSTSHVLGVVSGFGGISTLVGTSGTDTLVGADGATNTWYVTGTNSGQVDGFSFSGFENLQGGSAADTFALVNGGKETGTVNGGGGSNTLDHASGYTGNVTVDLPLGTASLVGGVASVRDPETSSAASATTSWSATAPATP